jgi:hypothetical protein
MRYIGAAPLLEDNSVKSSSSITSNLRINRKLTSDVDITLDVSTWRIARTTISVTTTHQEWLVNHWQV